MSKKKRVVVMVSLYNSGDWIENRLNNLMQSTILNQIEIWCVNANSPDSRDHDIPQRYPVKYERLPDRISVYETWNYIISKSDSEFITNANSDDIVDPGCYARLSAILTHKRDAGFAYPSWYTTEIPNQSWGGLRQISNDGTPGFYNGDIGKAGVGHFPMWRRELHDRLGMFDTRFKALADADWWARCYLVGKAKFLWVREFLACYLYRNGHNLWHKSISPEEWELYHRKAQAYQRGELV